LYEYGWFMERLGVRGASRHADMDATAWHQHVRGQ